MNGTAIRAMTAGQGAPPALEFVAHEDGRVEGEGAGRGGGESELVVEFVFLKPFPFVHDLLLDHRNHGVAAPEGERPDLKKGPEQL